MIDEDLAIRRGTSTYTDGRNFHLQVSKKERRKALFDKGSTWEMLVMCNKEEWLDVDREEFNTNISS